MKEWIKSKNNREIAQFVGGGITAIAVGAWALFQYFNPLPVPGPKPDPKASDFINLKVDAITLQFDQHRNGKVLAGMSIGNSADEAMLIQHISLGVTATSNRTGSVLSKRFDLASNLQIPSGSRQPIELGWSQINEWLLLLNPSVEKPFFDTHWFAFDIHLQGTSSSGRPVWLRVDAPKPVFMTCDTPCIAVYDLSVNTGASSFEECNSLPDPSGFALDCRVRKK